MGTPVAIKMILMPKDSSVSAQFDSEAFEAEVSMLCQLRHPHICLILGMCMYMYVCMCVYIRLCVVQYSEVRRRL